MSDYELVKNKEYLKLWNQYKGLLNVFYYKCVDALTQSGFPFDDYEDMQDFFYDCYPIVVNAVDSIKLEKIKKPETWTLYIQLYHYMQNFVNRDIIQPKLKAFSNGFQLLDIDDEKNKVLSYDDNELINIEDKIAFNQLIDIAISLGPKYIDVLNKVMNGKSSKKSKHFKEIITKYNNIKNGEIC